MLSPELRAADQAGLRYRVIRHGPVGSLAEAARARGVEPADVVKTLVVRRSADGFLFVLIPGDRTISWPKLRALLKVSRLSLPDAAVARDATGYERGTITPFGSRGAWPVIADERIAGREITLGAGEPGLAMAAPADDIIGVWGQRSPTSPSARTKPRCLPERRPNGLLRRHKHWITCAPSCGQDALIRRLRWINATSPVDSQKNLVITRRRPCATGRCGSRNSLTTEGGPVPGETQGTQGAPGDRRFLAVPDTRWPPGSAPAAESSAR